MNIQNHIKYSKTLLGLLAITTIIIGVYESRHYINENSNTGHIEISLWGILLTLFLHSLMAYLFFKAKQHFSLSEKISTFYSYSAIVLSIYFFFPINLIGIYLLVIQLKRKR